MNAARERPANWRNLAAETADARELRAFATRNGGKVLADAALAWLREHRDELPQLKTGIHPHRQLEMIQSGQGVDGVATHYDPSLTTRLVDDELCGGWAGGDGHGNRWVSHRRPYDREDDTGE